MIWVCTLLALQESHTGHLQWVFKVVDALLLLFAEIDPRPQFLDASLSYTSWQGAGDVSRSQLLSPGHQLCLNYS